MAGLYEYYDGSGYTLTFGDLDGDGDLDAIGGNYIGYLVFFENLTPPSPALQVIGVADGPVFRAQRYGASIFYSLNDDFSFDDYIAPALGDLDADGDLDLVLADEDGDIYFARNSGSPNNPVFDGDKVLDSDIGNPFYDVVAGDYIVDGYYLAPALVDIDNDGDLDAFFGEQGEYNATSQRYLGVINFLENTGSYQFPVFEERTGADNPFDAFNNTTLKGYTKPAFVDIDNDGDYDAFVGNYYGTAQFFENTGDAENPTFVERTGIDNPLTRGTVRTPASVAFADIDQDGDADAFLAQTSYFNYYRTILFFENVSPIASIAAGDNGSEEGPVNGSFTITLSDPAPAGGLEIAYTLGGDATEGDDYTLGDGTNTTVTSSTITIATGALTGTVTVDVIDDGDVEMDETVELTLDEALGYQVSAANNSASITITSEDTPTPTPTTTSTPTTTPTPTATPTTGPEPGDDEEVYLPFIGQ
jgi:hypothetical protein